MRAFDMHVAYNYRIKNCAANGLKNFRRIVVQRYRRASVTRILFQSESRCIVVGKKVIVFFSTQTCKNNVFRDSNKRIKNI